MRRVYTGPFVLPECALWAGIAIISDHDGDGVYGSGEVVGRVSFERGKRSILRYSARLPPGCPLVTMVDKVPLQG